MAHVTAGRPVPRWFALAALAALAWEMIGCVMYLMQVSVDPATLPLDQRAMWDAAPTWMVAAYAIAVWVGLVGAIFLLMRRRLAPTLLAISLIAVVVQFSALLVVPELRNLTTSNDLFLPFVILILGYAIWYFARTSRQAGWLR
ncbi:hypothetical protein [Sphingomonas sp.]|uniref:hypothetical protein n=1 Tax=Sphingomonas sp. TaxID=28214 RepID=UPI00286C8FDE|nr:hypothetical protein [Sphingomonas sp.]